MRAAIWLLFVFGLLLLVGGVYYWSRRRTPVSGTAAPHPEGRDVELAEELAVPIPTAETAPGPEPQLAPAPPPYDELPMTYGDNKIVLMVRDPEWLFAYWEINDQAKVDFARQYGSRGWEQSQPLVRVYDTTGVVYDGTNANKTLDIPINDNALSWHIHVGEPNRTYFAELGRLISNHFVPLARSNFVVTPRNRISDLIDEEWMMITDDEMLYGRYAYGLSSAYMVPASPQATERKDSVG